MKFGWKSVQGSDLEPTIEDFEQNGRFCLSGLAFETAPGEATCGVAKQITQLDYLLD